MISQLEARRLVERLVAHFDARSQEPLTPQLANLSLELVDGEGSHHLSSPVVGWASRTTGLVAEAETVDYDGHILSALLHVREGRLAELELVRDDGQLVHNQGLTADQFVVVFPVDRSDSGGPGHEPNPID